MFVLPVFGNLSIGTGKLNTKIYTIIGDASWLIPESDAQISISQVTLNENAKRLWN